MSALDFIDIIGTFVFALSGVTAGIRKNFDIFGVFVLAFVTAVGGGVMRDVIINATPPAGLVNPVYGLAVIVAVTIGVIFHSTIIKMEKPTLWLDALGLGFFAAFGAEKTFRHTGNIQLSIIMGCLSAVGGGALRDILAGRSPVIFSRDIYASAAIVGAGIAVLGPLGILPAVWATWAAIVIGTAIRIITMHYKIHFPAFEDKTPPKR
ncbi:MAG: Hypothetical protein BHV28_03910 [Candidatus Tokpelaia hoelldobleri]|uniref:Glycine transporter domain-containing protein n=1 Tax=Candidatus Tokpelaia hoelldobleri TaxID=1902579 RepID=A0A1U9JTA8_9HYPH|nr:MAG: Hypothetical protein BHV28_03910 [Candidatus Tokpelaia hoelldoblerii]